MGCFSSGESVKLKQAIENFNEDISELGLIKHSSTIGYW